MGVGGGLLRQLAKMFVLSEATKNMSTHTRDGPKTAPRTDAWCIKEQ